MKIITTSLVGAVIAMAAPMASAATVSIEAITGSWVAISDNNTYGVSIDNAGADAEVRWGKTPSASAAAQAGLRPGQFGPQSGYTFESAVPPVISPAAGAEFELGVFTHHNWPIHINPNGQATSIEWAELEVSFDVKINDQMFNVTRNFVFDHTETANDGVTGNGDCEFSGYAAALDDLGCADRVSIRENQDLSSSVTVDGVLYTFDLSGFEVEGDLTSEFFTRESADNQAILVGSYTAQELSPVPLPAAGWMLIAGVGGLAALKRKKARANT